MSQPTLSMGPWTAIAWSVAFALVALILVCGWMFRNAAVRDCADQCDGASECIRACGEVL